MRQVGNQPKGNVVKLLVRSRSDIANEVAQIELVDPRRVDLPSWAPGAHIELHLGNGMVRHFSLCSDPADLSHYVIAVLREKDGRGGSAWMHENIRAGDELEMVGPRNHFPLEAAAAYVFLAGGIGITPLMPMIAAVAARGVEYRIVYGGRTRDSMAFLDQVAGHGQRATIVPQDEAGLIDLAGVVTTAPPGAAIYCCGPEPLIAAAQAECERLERGPLRFERFAASRDERGEAHHDGDEPFEVRLVKTGQTVKVGADQTLLEVLEELGADVFSDCREGICGSCEVPVLAGGILHRDSVLSTRERDAGDIMMSCVSRAASGQLDLDL